jgi:hypothetical protein
LKALGKASADINHCCFCFVIIAKWKRKTNVSATELFGGDKENLKKLQAVPFHPQNSQNDLRRKEKTQKKHGALDNKSLCGQKNYLLENNQRHVIEFLCLAVWLIFAL